jgi:hypothetical protein
MGILLEETSINLLIQKQLEFICDLTLLHATVENLRS